ncbi:MAG: transglycosylase SLT domain-containing protein [Lautropia sp.]
MKIVDVVPACALGAALLMAGWSVQAQSRPGGPAGGAPLLANITAVPDPATSDAAAVPEPGADAPPADAPATDAPATDAPATNAPARDAVPAAAPREPIIPPLPRVAAVDDAFVAARKAMTDGDLDRFDRVVQPIPRDHPLAVYVDYWRLRILLGGKRLEALTGEADQAVRAFLARYPDTIAGDLLRRDWLLALGRRGDWSQFDAEYPKWSLRDESAPDCYAQMSALAKLPIGRKLAPKAAQQARALVQRPVVLNRACSDLVDALAAANQLQPAELRQRLLLALEANAPADIRQAYRQIAAGSNERELEFALAKPAAALKTALPRELQLVALVRLARSDPADAAARLPQAAALSADERRFVWSQIAAAGMRRLAPEAYAWAREATGARVSDETRVWLARAALRQQDWALLRTTINAMGDQERSEAAWVYWLGRAQQALGHKAEANRLFESLTARFDFYGKLAAEELGRPLAVPPRPEPPPAALVRSFDGNAGFARAEAFYAIGLRFEGNREWNWQLRGQSEQTLRAAATWAMQRQLLDRAINTDERIRSDADYALRFPTPYAERLLPITRSQNLDAAWVYGLIRQESRFIVDARSHVGASGLMQLMPATARWVAKKMGRKDYSHKDLNELQTNLEFGSFYLKATLDDHDGSAVLASAGYNAGPVRARNWRSALGAPVEGAIFAEIIPFTETRGYVKNVLSNATDYAALLSGQPQSLKARLGTIEPKAAGVTALP